MYNNKHPNLIIKNIIIFIIIFSLSEIPLFMKKNPS